MPRNAPLHIACTHRHTHTLNQLSPLDVAAKVQCAYFVSKHTHQALKCACICHTSTKEVDFREHWPCLVTLLRADAHSGFPLPRRISTCWRGSNGSFSKWRASVGWYYIKRHQKNTNFRKPYIVRNTHVPVEFIEPSCRPTCAIRPEADS